MYEMLANERIATYQREAVLDRRGLDAAKGGKAARPVANGRTGKPDAAMRSSRLGLAAVFAGLAAASVLRRKD